MTISAPAFSLSDVGVVRDGAWLLRDVNCTFSGSGITGLVGQNGSGKTTLMRVLARQLTPQKGSITLGDRDFATFSPRAFAQQVAYLPQSAPHAPGMTVRELVSAGRYPWHGALSRFGPQDALRVNEALELTSTGRLSDRMVDSLSGGERQRCWLAMLLAQGARLLLLDEPTSALDLAHQHSVLQLLSDISRQHEVASIVIIHDVNLAARFCDFIVALKGGRVVADGTPETLMTPDRLEAVFDVPMLVAPHPESGRPFCFVRDVPDARPALS